MPPRRAGGRGLSDPGDGRPPADDPLAAPPAAPVVPAPPVQPPAAGHAVPATQPTTPAAGILSRLLPKPDKFGGGGDVVLFSILW